MNTAGAQQNARASPLVSETLPQQRVSPSRGLGRALSRDYATSKVPEAVVAFWLTKALSTALGESVSDWLVHAIAPVPAVLLGFVGFVVALLAQLRATSYRPWRYWSAVAMVGVFGTMAADVLHVGFKVPYVASTALFVVVLAAVFALWYRTEHTLSIHTIVTLRRELFYWAAVVATFALGTAVGDLAATTGGLGYFPSAVVFGVADPGPGRGVPVVALEPGAVVLGRVRPDPAGRGVGGGRAGQADAQRRPRDRPGSGQRRARRRDARLRRLPRPHAGRRAAPDGH